MSIRNAVLAYGAYFRLKEYLSTSDLDGAVNRVVLFEENEGIPMLFHEITEYYKTNPLPSFVNTHVPIKVHGYDLLKGLFPEQQMNIKMTKLMDYIFMSIQNLFRNFATAIQIAKETAGDNSKMNLANYSIETKVVEEIDVITFVFLYSLGILRGGLMDSCMQVLSIDPGRFNFVLGKCKDGIFKGYKVCDFSRRKDDPDGTTTASDTIDSGLRRRLSFMSKNETITGKVTSLFTNYMHTNEPYALRILVGMAFYLTKKNTQGGTLARTKTLLK